MLWFRQIIANGLVYGLLRVSASKLANNYRNRKAEGLFVSKYEPSNKLYTLLANVFYFLRSVPILHFRTICYSKVISIFYLKIKKKIEIMFRFFPQRESVLFVN